MSSTKAQSKLYAFRVYVDRKQKKSVLAKLKPAAKKEGRSIGRFLLMAGLEKADRLLLGQEAK